MKIRNIFTAAALAVVIAAGSARAAEPTAPATLFEYPSVPDKLTKPAMRANFMVEHLWDKCNLEKTAVTDLAAFHNTFTDYLSFFALADKAVVEKSIKKYVERVAKNPTNLNLTVGMLHSEVLNLRSQYCSDEVYTMFADNIAAAKKVDKALKAKLQAQAAVLANSAVGATVADFPLRQSPAGAASLYGLTAGTTILFFNSDGCVDCSIYKVRLSASIAASSLIKEGRLRIVSVYGGDPAAVESKLATEPADWEVACIDTAAYDQRLRPAVYVLDSDKKITTKFVDIDSLLRAIESVEQADDK